MYKALRLLKINGQTVAPGMIIPPEAGEYLNLEDFEKKGWVEKCDDEPSRNATPLARAETRESTPAKKKPVTKKKKKSIFSSSKAE